MLGKISYLDHEGRESVRYFVNTASFGASGKVAGEANRSSKLFGGKITFAAATLKTTFTYDNPEVSISIDDGDLHASASSRCSSPTAAIPAEA